MPRYHVDTDTDPDALFVNRNLVTVEFAAEHLDAYHRLAHIDPPVLRSLVVELKRVSDESAASAALEGTPEATARARRNAERAAAARTALDAVVIEN